MLMRIGFRSGCSRSETLGEQLSCATIVVKLLEDAGRILGDDHEAARAYIDRAAALLRNDRDYWGRGIELVRAGSQPGRCVGEGSHRRESQSSTIRLQDLAEMSRLSRSHFSRAFKKSFGETFSSYIARAASNGRRT
jgi:AraC family transcriptional regulator